MRYTSYTFAKSADPDEVVGQLVFEEDTSYVDNTLSTASWYDVYTIKAGSYDIVGAKKKGDLVARVDAILEEEYRVNRLLTASSSETRTPKTEKVLTMSDYSFVFARFVGEKNDYRGGRIVLNEGVELVAEEKVF